MANLGKCTQCGKSVYGLEKAQVEILAHKGCWRCAVCKLTLNQRNSKTFEGKFYCNTHYPPSVSKVTSFENDRKADSGTFESTASSSSTDAGGSWGGGKADSGEFVKEGVAYEGGGGGGGGAPAPVAAAPAPAAGGGYSGGGYEAPAAAAGGGYEAPAGGYEGYEGGYEGGYDGY